MDQITEDLFKDILKRERALRGWSQADVAAKIGSDPKTVGRWERGLTSPSPYMSQQLCALYGKTMQELRLVKTVRIPSTQGKLDPDNKEEHTIPPTLQAATPASPPEQKSVEITSPRSHRRATKRRSLLLSVLSVFILLVILGIWLLPRMLSPTALPHRVLSSLSLDPYTGKGVLVLNNSLKANTVTSWSLSNNDEGQCFFADGNYRIRGIKTGGYMKLCLAANTYFSNLTYEAKMQVVVGDCGGLAFRATFPLLYYFLICQDGNYRFVRYDRDDTSNRRIMVAGVSSAIRRGLNITNVLAVVAHEDTFALYVNHVLIYHGTDAAYFDGQIGLLAHTCSIVYLDSRPDICAVPVEVVFSDAKVWKG